MKGGRGHLRDGEEISVQTDERNFDANRRIRIHQDDHISGRRNPTCKLKRFISKIHISIVIANNLAFN